MNILLANMPLKFNAFENLEPPLGISFIAAVLEQANERVYLKDYEVAYLYILKSRIRRELLSLKVIAKIFKILKSVLKRRRIRGNNVATYFPFTETLFLEFWLLLRNQSLISKFNYLRKVIIKEKEIRKKYS